MRYNSAYKNKNKSGRKKEGHANYHYPFPIPIQLINENINDSNPFDILGTYIPVDFSKPEIKKKETYIKVIDALEKLKKTNNDLLTYLKNKINILIKEYNGIFLHFRTKSRLALGLSSPSPLEVGFCIHPIYGIPYIPATSLKGTALRKCPKEEKEEKETIFGCQERAGDVIFLDAFPDNPKLELDIMTPHYQKWYSGSNPTPDEDDNPIPINFLVIPEGADFYGGLIPRHFNVKEETLNKAFQLLKEALDDLGLGAKTSSGYGWIEVSIEELKKPSGEKKEKSSSLEENYYQEVKREIENFQQKDFGLIDSLINKIEKINRNESREEMVKILIGKLNKDQRKKIENKLRAKGLIK